MQLKRDDRGVTLIELLVVIAILGVIVAPLTAAFIMFLRNTNQAQDRLEVSHDAQIAGAYFSQDVASIGRHDWGTAGYPLQQSVELNALATVGNTACGTASTPIAVIRLSWDNPGALPSDTTLIRVSYVLEGHELHRIKCVDSATVVSDIVIAHNIVGTIAPPNCSSSCLGATPPQTISITLTIQVNGSTDQPLVITLTGQRRQT
jgi:prepilin-type N-terminal cleavage/methylation domain-containing protein